MRMVLEMETSDPDDFPTLLWLADHPAVDLLTELLGHRDAGAAHRTHLD